MLLERDDELHEQAVGSQPYGLAIDQQAGTVYVADTFQAGSLSILSARTN